MMEQALRLFENLGFKVVAYNPETYILYEREKVIEAEPKNFMIKEYVSFTTKMPSGELIQKVEVKDECSNAYYIDMPLLKAINQQCKELGWLK